MALANTHVHAKKATKEMEILRAPQFGHAMIPQLVLMQVAMDPLFAETLLLAKPAAAAIPNRGMVTSFQAPVV
jgi:hypothetical protein